MRRSLQINVQSRLCLCLAVCCGIVELAMAGDAEIDKVNVPGVTTQPSVTKAIDPTLPIVNSQELRINYAVSETLTKAGASGVLWYRRDDGQWRRGMSFKAGKKIEYKVEGQGEYEFAVDFTEAVSGKETNGPASDASRFKCFVDYTKPLLTLEDVSYGNGKFLIRWRAYDAYFSSRPIDIYLIRSNGESILLGKYANSGAAVVAVDVEMLPGKVKVSATDQAGNSVSELSGIIRSPVIEAKPIVVATRPVATQPAIVDEPVIKLPKIKEIMGDGDIKSAMRDYKAGTEYRYRGQRELAVMHFKRAIDQAPEFIAAYIDLGGVLSAMKRYNEAETWFLQALARDEKNVRAWRGLAISKARSHKYRQAKYCLEKMIALDKKDVEGWLLLGDAYWATGQKVDARLAWFKAQAIIEESGSDDLSQAVASRIKLIKKDEEEQQDKR